MLVQKQSSPRSNLPRYYAVDTADHPMRLLHFSCLKLTTSKAYAWTGTSQQFDNMIEQFGWDSLTLIPVHLFK